MINTHNAYKQINNRVDFQVYNQLNAQIFTPIEERVQNKILGPVVYGIRIKVDELTDDQIERQVYIQTLNQLQEEFEND